MDLIQKIKSTTWFNNVFKTRDILLEITTNQIGEAPMDGIAYIRKNGEWVVAETSNNSVPLTALNGISSIDMDDDGYIYFTKNGMTSKILGEIEE